ncbi:GH92 family glycosyl hydrolase [Rapidithrix thailandica]|uniref:GH92 family glycosyl hydrolase n=1 Tax=Rapidithrix thailandica TaxID=413964 RepID=A0AAW9S0Q1_9BACT
MKNLLLVLGLTALFFSACQPQKDTKESPQTASSPEDLTAFVNPLVGSDSEFKFSNGNTYPAIALPWGMNFWSPQTGKNGDGWAYQYQKDSLVGIKQTHQPSPWINDYGAFSLMAITGELKTQEKERASKFSHDSEVVLPHYYKVDLESYGIQAEVTPTERAAVFRFTFPESEAAYILLDAYHKGSYVKVLPEERKIIGWAKNNSGGVPANFANYFVAEFDKDFTTAGTWTNEGVSEELEKEAERTGAYIQFATQPGETVHVKVASSFISQEQAQQNMAAEIGSKDFETLKTEAQAAWNKELNKIQVKGGSEKAKKNFYTSLYRVLLFPRKFYEYTKEGKIVHYSPYNGKVLDGYMFTDNGFWDTFRAVFPFFTVMYPEMNSQIMQGLVNTYKESGWLPEWASPGHRDCMIGSNSASIIADAYLKGIRGYDIETLYEAILKNSENAGPLTSVGRFGVDYYNKLGYIPYDVKVNENVARTLEYAYADFTIMQLAKELGKPQEEIDRFAKRAQNYRNVFDPTTNFMRARYENGQWQTPFVPEAWGGAFTEGSSWHYTWSVFQDPQGLIDLMGGDDAFNAKLDSVFSMDPIFDFTYYGFEIHEITEMVAANMGQYAHGNQPIQHAIYLYNYSGQPWKAQKHLREVMDKLYAPTPDGLCGDEDNGQTSAWYVFSSMGFYPVCPGTDEYAIGSPMFEEVKLQLENGNTFTIKAANNSAENLYIQSATLNGQAYSKTYLTHGDIQKGGEVHFEMSNTPNQEWGTQLEDRPYSMSQPVKQ